MWKNRIVFGLIIVLLAGVIGEYLWFNNKLTAEDRTVATISGQKITQSEFIKEVKELYGKEVLDQIINRKIVELAAGKYGITASQDEIDRQYNQFKQDYATEEDFQNYLKDQMGWTKEQLKNYIKYNILWEEIATKDINISEDELKQRYKNNPSSYSEPEKFHIEQIVVKTKDDADKVVDELNNGSNFNTLAKEKSIDALSLGSGGDLGYISVTDPSVDPTILEKVKTMDTNDLATVELSNNTYAIIKLLDYKKEITYSYDEVKNEIKRDLALSQVPSLPEVLEKLKKEMNVKILDPSFK